MPVTLREVAARLNLSIGLVSGVLNDRPNVWASQETRQRIHAVAAEMAYRPNAAARALSSRRANAIAFIVSDSSPAYTEMIGILTRYLNARGCELLVRMLSSQEEVLSHLNELARTRAFDGAILWGLESDVEEQGLLLESLDIPFISKGRHENTHPDWPQIDFDHEGMMAQSVEHLVNCGHQRIFYLGYEAEAPFSACLKQGFRAAMRRHTGEWPNAEWIKDYVWGSGMFHVQMLRWLDLPEESRPTALVIGGSKDMWLEVELALASRNRTIGNRLPGFAVTGITISEMRLLFGQADAFTEVGFSDLASAIVDRLLPPLLNREPILQPIVRILPTLHPIESLNLLDLRLFRHDPA